MKTLHLLAFTFNYFTTKFCVHILCPPDIATSPETNRIQSIPSRPPTAALNPSEKRKEKISGAPPWADRLETFTTERLSVAEGLEFGLNTLICTIDK